MSLAITYPLDLTNLFTTGKDIGAPMDAWSDLCNQLQSYTPPPSSLVVSNKERKWELISAYQKSIRRGDEYWAPRLVSAMCSMPEEYGFFWRRVCTTSCEDIGPVNPTLAMFVVACGSLFGNKGGAKHFSKIVNFLTEQMVSSRKSRIWCRMKVLGDDWNITPANADEADAITIFSGGLEEGPLLKWAQKCRWLCEGMLEFAALNVKPILSPYEQKIPETVVLYGLPTYAYDQHTRTGGKVLRILTGVGGIKEVLSSVPEKKLDLLKDAFFYESSALCKDHYSHAGIRSLGWKVLCSRAGCTQELFDNLRAEVRLVLDNGTVDRLLEKSLKSAYGK